MHSSDPNKNQNLFSEEIRAILLGTSRHRRGDRFDFTGFVFEEEVLGFHKMVFEQDVYFTGTTFMEFASFAGTTFTHCANFEGARFKKLADFGGATFAQDANFASVTFKGNVYFSGATFTNDVSFINANFTQSADFTAAKFAKCSSFNGTSFKQNAGFDRVTFNQDVSFMDATFMQGAAFQRADFVGIANFHSANFAMPERIIFQEINKATAKVENPPGLRARFANCRLEKIRFEDVNWHRRYGRLMLQDEIDTAFPTGWRLSHELAAIVYRRLVSNFEEARAYHDAEDCKIGAMEMERLDPGQPLLRRLAATIYKWASLYGSSYQRALAVLLTLLIGFGLLFALPTVNIEYASKEGPLVVQSMLTRIGGGLSHSFDIATFQRVDPHEFKGFLWRPLTFAESIMVPSQLALFLLALRRRFRT